MSGIKIKKQEIEKRDLKKFGMTMGVAFLVITAIFSAKHQRVILPVLFVSLAFFILAVLAPRLLRPVYIIWMRFAHIVSWINTRLILTAIFYLVFTPMGLFIKLVGKDLLDRKIEKSKDSYWHKKENKEFDALSYERQF